MRRGILVPGLAASIPVGSSGAPGLWALHVDAWGALKTSLSLKINQGREQRGTGFEPAGCAHTHYPIASRVAFDPLATPTLPCKTRKLRQKRLKAGGGRGNIRTKPRSTIPKMVSMGPKPLSVVSQWHVGVQPHMPRLSQPASPHNSSSSNEVLAGIVSDPFLLVKPFDS
jgi:hypothetical protein